MKYKDVEAEVAAEIIRAIDHFPKIRSLHEGYAIILEEIDELWAEIKKKDHDMNAIKTEALQVAAMALRLVMDFFDT